MVETPNARSHRLKLIVRAEVSVCKLLLSDTTNSKTSSPTRSRYWIRSSSLHKPPPSTACLHVRSNVDIYKTEHKRSFNNRDRTGSCGKKRSRYLCQTSWEGVALWEECTSCWSSGVKDQPHFTKHWSPPPAFTISTCLSRFENSNMLPWEAKLCEQLQSHVAR